MLRPSNVWLSYGGSLIFTGLLQFQNHPFPPQNFLSEVPCLISKQFLSGFKEGRGKENGLDRGFFCLVGLYCLVVFLIKNELSK